jgi:ribosomal peptide maturation radical SAM protein 1
MLEHAPAAPRAFMTDRPIALVSMPTASGRFPCFQLGLLKPTLERAGFSVEPYSLYLRFGEHLGWRLHEALAEVYPCLAGEWIWAREAFPELRDLPDEEYLALYGDHLEVLCEHGGCTIDDLRRVRDEAGRFLDACLELTDWGRFSFVGFTVLFQQQLATLALARRLKERWPALPIVLGGGVFEDDIADELLRHCPQIDCVHCGDADETLPELACRLASGERLDGLPGVMWRDGEHVVYVGRAPNYPHLDLTPVPDFDEYFELRESTGYGAWEGADEPVIPFEAARGCWWGERCQCTFCGLNRAGLEFRSKSVASTLAMLEELAVRHGVLRFAAIDNIVAPEYVDGVFGALAAARCDFKIHYEIRPNLTRRQLARMRLGGLTSVQPGIESFSTNVLRCMRKGLPAVRNLELLKWSTYYGIENLYNILVGFAGETEQDYREQRELLALIPHLQPPYQMAPARPDRGSPMHAAPAEHGITRLDPEPCYRFLFPSRFELARVSYYYRPQREGALSEEAYAGCTEVVARWKERWASDARPTLLYRKHLESITIVDRRGDEERTLRLAGREAQLYERCGDARRLTEIEARFGGAASWINQLLDELLSAGLLVHLDGRYLSLALPAYPYFGLEADPEPVD